MTYFKFSREVGSVYLGQRFITDDQDIRQFKNIYKHWFNKSFNLNLTSVLDV